MQATGHTVLSPGCTLCHVTLPHWREQVPCHLPPRPRPWPQHSRLLEAPHAVQDVELLPPFGKVHLAVYVVRVPQVNEGQVLQDEPPGGTERPGYLRRMAQAAGVQLSHRLTGPRPRGRARAATKATGTLRCVHFFWCGFPTPLEKPGRGASGARLLQGPSSDCPGLQRAVRGHLPQRTLEELWVC